MKHFTAGLVMLLACVYRIEGCTREYDPYCLTHKGVSTLHSNRCYMMIEYERLRLLWDIPLMLQRDHLSYRNGLCFEPVCDNNLTGAKQKRSLDPIALQLNSYCVTYTDGQHNVHENVMQLNMFLCDTGKTVKTMYRCSDVPDI